MKKRLNHKNSSAEPQVKPDTTELILKMQQQLVFLEKKIDTLLSQSSHGPFEAKPHSKPFQRFRQPHGRGEAIYGQDRGERTLHKAVCADCGNECEVPFRPSQDRPVYCRECFSKRKAGSSFKPSQDNRPRGRGFTQKRPFSRYMGMGKRKPVEKGSKAYKK